MASLYKYDIVVLDAKHTKEREDRFYELGRSGWEIVSVLPGDYKNGDKSADMISLFMKREATHDINF